jgi:hypothetical protein
MVRTYGLRTYVLALWVDRGVTSVACGACVCLPVFLPLTVLFSTQCLPMLVLDTCFRKFLLVRRRRRRTYITTTDVPWYWTCTYVNTQYCILSVLAARTSSLAS